METKKALDFMLNGYTIDEQQQIYYCLLRMNNVTRT